MHIRSKTQRGHVVVTVLLCLFLATALGFSMASLTGYDLRAADRVRNSAVAFNLAESGAERAVRWLRSYAYPPMYSVEAFGGTQSLGGGTYHVDIVPDPSNSRAFLKRYKILAVGNYRGASERVELFVRQQSFGRYAYFTDSEVSSITGTPIWFYAGDRIRGPAHSNNANGTIFQIDWDKKSTQPIFEDIFTAAGSDINYMPSHPQVKSRKNGDGEDRDEYLSIFKNGVNGFQLNVDPIPLPSSADEQKVAAWGSSSGFPTTDGVYVNPGGGIYIRGNAAIKMDPAGDGVQQFTITQGLNTYYVTVDAVSGTTTKKIGTKTEVVNGGNSGVVYSTGDITSLSGTIADNKVAGGTVQSRNAYTIAADTIDGRTITLASDLRHKSTYNTALPPSDPANLKPGTVGLFARNVKVASSAPTNMEIDAVILAGNSTQPDGSFYVENWATKQPTGVLRVLGGVIQKARGPVGTVNGLTILSGYSKDYWYDERLADMPPPYFPTTGGYDKLSWRRFSQ